ncbi:MULTISPECIES: hypothetical protein [Escherichia]|uniref:hypothetical protein n=1 Tax=Escherichia TaxID=561 RepID=UPI000BEA8E7A|nr:MULTISPECIES: hypothetical protein [Escherichia]MCQ8913758.1 hypothetical protein [Escherichia albertii]MCQ8922574.1 hypothetical protein [Escherichia albertii]MCQ8922910.1 hypothetical protein [Escherichia albertii]MCQ8981328.1 hypothetical protein [Escherichia albertii]MCQ8994639.1 hypothetical protein [Escherichia albertii]
MNTLTKEWLQNTITGIESIIDDKSFVCSEIAFEIGVVNNILTAFKIALASLAAEPVAWMRDDADGREYNARNEFSGGGKGVPLYRVPPAPVVPAVLERLRSIVTDPRALTRRKEWVSGQQYSYVLLEDVEAMVDEACRAAMLKGDKS